MSAQPPTERRPLLPLVLLHLAAACACFAFFTVVPILGLLALMAIGNDPGGPMVLPIFALGVLVLATAITVVLAGTALLSDLLRRRFQVPVCLPPLAVLGLATATTWYFLGGSSPLLPLLAGGAVSVAFIVHWSAVSATWFLPRFLCRLLRVRSAPSDH